MVFVVFFGHDYCIAIMTERGARGVVNRCSVAILKHTQVGEASVLAFSAEVDSLFMVIKVETTQEITFTQCCVGHSYREHDQNDRRHWQGQL